MAVATQAARKTRIKLVNGRSMTCPRCKRPHDILEFIPMMQIEEFADETTPVYKCPRCRWVFAPTEKITLDFGPLMEVK